MQREKQVMRGPKDTIKQSFYIDSQRISVLICLSQTEEVRKIQNKLNNINFVMRKIVSAQGVTFEEIERE